MKTIAVSQRVDVIQSYGERRDALDQRWTMFLHAVKLLPLLIPNHLQSAKALITTFQPDCFLFTGGNTLVEYGGSAGERDVLERFLLEFAIANRLSVLGVCRGMQMIQSFFGITLKPVKGHVAVDHTLFHDHKLRVINSYHDFGSKESVPELEVRAMAEDGVIEAFRHKTLPIFGIMWHPERFNPFQEDDFLLFHSIFANDGDRHV